MTRSIAMTALVWLSACTAGVVSGDYVEPDGDAGPPDESAVCGDGVLHPSEECDDGNTDPGDGCDPTCELEGPLCGNGEVEPPEQCDDGNTLPYDGCSETCRIERCGDGVLQPGEQCDDGNTVPGDGCDATCGNEVTPACGNGVLEAGEQCDDGNTDPGDGCDPTCAEEPDPTCTPDFDLRCGKTDTWNTTSRGSRDDIDQYSCTSRDASGREYGYRFVSPITGRVTVQLYGCDPALDLYLIEDTDGVCEASACQAWADRELSFDAVAGETYYVVVDGHDGAQGSFSVYVHCAASW